MIVTPTTKHCSRRPIVCYGRAPGHALSWSAFSATGKKGLLSVACQADGAGRDLRAGCRLCEDLQLLAMRRRGTLGLSPSVCFKKVTPCRGVRLGRLAGTVTCSRLLFWGASCIKPTWRAWQTALLACGLPSYCWLR